MARLNYRELKKQLIDMMFDISGGAAVLEDVGHKDIAEFLGIEYNNAARVAISRLLKELHDELVIITLPSDAGRSKGYLLVDNATANSVERSELNINKILDELRTHASYVKPTNITLDLPAGQLIRMLVTENRFLWGFYNRVCDTIGAIERGLGDEGEQQEEV